MTLQETLDTIRVCGEEYEQSDIPAFIRRREENRIPKSLKAGKKIGRRIFKRMVSGFNFLGFSPYGKESE